MAEILQDPEGFGERPLDHTLIVGRLQELGVSIEADDLEGENDNDVIALIAGFATMYDLDIDDVLPQVIPIEKRKRDDN